MRNTEGKNDAREAASACASAECVPLDDVILSLRLHGNPACWKVADRLEQRFGGGRERPDQEPSVFDFLTANVVASPLVGLGEVTAAIRREEDPAHRVVADYLEQRYAREARVQAAHTIGVPT